MSTSFQPFLAYSASAGSGKTFALTARYLSLLFLGESPATILAATFTNKAAAQMRHRVIDALRHLPEARFAPLIESIHNQTGMDRETLLAHQPRVLARFLAQPNHIVTLDSFFTSILRSASLEIGLEPDFVVQIEDPDATTRRLVEHLYRYDQLHRLRTVSLLIEDKRFHKLRSLLEQLYALDPLLNTPPSPPEAHALEATQQQIETVRTRLQQAVIDAGASSTAINAFAPASASDLLRKSVMGKASLKEHRNFAKYVAKYPQIETDYQTLRSLLARWSRLRESQLLSRLFELYEAYRTVRIDQARTERILHFDDATLLAHRLLRGETDRAFIYFRIDAHFHHILLDEFQDTSTLQFLLLEPLIGEITAGKGQKEFRSFFYVGDTKQSLYRFRGGVEALFDRVASLYQIPVEPMDTNYRSSRHVIEHVNSWFVETMPDYHPQKPAPGASEGYVYVEEVDTEDELIDAALRRAKTLHDHYNVAWSDLAFLVATNANGQTLQDALQTAGIPTRLKTSSSLRTLSPVAALVAMVAYLYRGDPIDAYPLLIQSGRTLEEWDRSTCNVWMTPLQMLDQLIRDFSFFDRDPNLLRLLEFAAGFEDVSLFLDAFRLSQIEVAPHSLSGAQIMTIHGAKGLEFAHVIVLDRFKRPPPDRSALLFDYQEDLSLRHIYLRSSKRENVDAEYAQALDRARALAHKDRLNLLYVAMTRAATGLNVLRRSKESLFDPIDLRPTSTGTPVRASVPSATPPHDRTPLHRPAPEHYGSQPTPSSSTPEEDAHDRNAILFGTALHYALEMMTDFDPGTVKFALEAMRNRYGQLLLDHQIDDIRTRLERLTTDTSFRALIAEATLWQEQPISYRGEVRRIDLLLEYPDHYTVIDYKSSDKHLGDHVRQMRDYIQAIESIRHKPTDGYLLYLLPKTIALHKIDRT